jgi:two-component system, NarL family, response regulator NreC
MCDRIRVVLADDHAVVRAGLRAIISTAKDIEVVAEATNGRDAVDVAARFDPDVIVMDLTMGQLDGIAATREIVAATSGARVLVLTMHAEEDFLLTALDAGASGYLVKSAAERELVDAIRALSHGDMYVQPTAARVLAGRVQRNNPGAQEQRLLASLSARELDVLRLVAEGYSGPLIGERMAISAKTVDTYKQRIGEKLGLAGRPAFVRFALRVGLLNAGSPSGGGAVLP